MLYFIKSIDQLPTIVHLEEKVYTKLKKCDKIEYIENL